MKKQEKLKIILFSNLFPNLREKERGIFTFNIYNILKKYCLIKVVSPLPFFPSCLRSPLFDKWSVYANVPFTHVVSGIETYYPKYITFPRIGDYFSHIALSVRFYFFLRKRLSQWKPDVINAHWAYPDGVVAARIGELFNIPVVISLLGSDINRDLKKNYYKKLILNSLKQCQKITTVSKELRDVIVSHGIAADKVVVIHNGVDCDKFQIGNKRKAREKLGLDPEVRYILFVGRLEVVKGVDFLIKSIEEYRTRLKNVKVVLVGDGSLRHLLETQISQSDLDDYFFFAGQQSHDLIGTWLTASDLFCLPSLNEGHPNVVMEALASGIPVVASDVGAIAQFVTTQSGRVVPSGDVQALGKAICYCLSVDWDPNTIRQSVQEYSWDNTAGQYLGMFEEVLEENHA